MRNQRGMSLLFLLLIVALAGVVLAWLGLPYSQAMRHERNERDIARGVAPPASVHPSTEHARERSRIIEFAEVHGGVKSLAGTDAYRALSPGCRELVDAYVDAVDRPADLATDQPALRARVAEIERSFGAECLEVAGTSPPAPPPPDAQAVMRQEAANLEAYRALSQECRGYVDTFVGLMDNPGLTPSDRERIAEAERLYMAQCIDRRVQAKAEAERRAADAEEVRKRACVHRREEADALRALVDRTLSEAPPAAGTIDEDRRARREALEANQARLRSLDDEIAAECP